MTDLTSTSSQISLLFAPLLDQNLGYCFSFLSMIFPIVFVFRSPLTSCLRTCAWWRNMRPPLTSFDVMYAFCSCSDSGRFMLFFAWVGVKTQGWRVGWVYNRRLLEVKYKYTTKGKYSKLNLTRTRERMVLTRRVSQRSTRLCGRVWCHSKLRRQATRKRNTVSYD